MLVATATAIVGLSLLSHAALSIDLAAYSKLNFDFRDSHVLLLGLTSR
jgi:hypothetical protein